MKQTHYGKQIRRARNEKDLTQEQLADKLFVTKQAVSNWERGVNDIDEETKEKLEEILGIRLVEPYVKKERTNMEIKELDQIESIDELMDAASRIVDATPVDMAYASTVKKMLSQILNLVLGYEVYAMSFERERWKKEYKNDPLVVTDLSWEDVSEVLFSIFDKRDPYPIPQEGKKLLLSENLYLAKIEYLLHSVGGKLFHDFDEDGYREGYIQQVGSLAEADTYNLLAILPEQENALLTSLKASLIQMAEIVEGLVNNKNEE